MPDRDVARTGMDLERQAPTHSLPVLPFAPMMVMGPVGGGEGVGEDGELPSSSSANAGLVEVTMDVNTPVVVMNSFLVVELELDDMLFTSLLLLLLLILLLLCTAVPAR